MNYQLHFSDKRKTIALQIKNGNLIVRAPVYLSKTQVDQFVLSKQSWVDKKLAIFAQANQQPEFSYQDGEKLFVFGEQRCLSILTGATQDVYLSQERFVITLTPSQQASKNKTQLIRKCILAWFNHQVELYLHNKLFFYQSLTGLNSTSLKVRLYKSRWGSCNNRGALTFNSLLAMVPKAVFDYVIVHELCHLRHMNHSAVFWQLVAKYLPDFNQQKLWLKHNQKQLTLPLIQ